MSLIQLARYLARHQLAKKPAGVDPESYMTFPEKKFIEGAKPGELDAFNSMRKAATRTTKHFGETTPSSHTIVTLAQLGSPSKGEYQRSFETATALFGHDVDGVAAWQAVNAALSPRTEYLHHAGAATLIVANWLAEGKPQDPAAIRNLIKRVHQFGKLYTPDLYAKAKRSIDPETKRWTGLKGENLTFGGTTTFGMNVDRAVRVLSNIKEMREALLDPAGNPGERLALLSGGGLLKVPNFALSYNQPHYGAALDMWMSHTMFHPGLEGLMNHGDFLSQVKAGLSDPSEFTALENKARKGYPIRSDLVKAIMKIPENKILVNVKNSKTGVVERKPKTVSGFLQDMNSKLLSDVPTYLGLKHSVAEAAKTLGWNLNEVQESAWSGIVSIAAAISLGIPPKKIHEYLTHDAIQKGWQNHEAFIFPGLVDAYRRIGVSKSLVKELGERAVEGASSRSRPGIVPVGDVAHLQRIAAYMPPSARSGKDAAGKVREAVYQHLVDTGLIDPNTGQIRTQRQGYPTLLQRLRHKFAKYDLPLDFVSALDRAVSTDQQTFAEHLKRVLMQSGITPHEVSPAVHDYAGAARASVVAAGSFKGGQMTPLVGTAWTGLLGRQPGMLTFQTGAGGPDSVYRFAHNDADAIRAVLDKAGVKSRVLAPKGKSFHVFVYDQGRKNREGVAQALTALGVPAEEWRGTGTPVGGKQDDMGREQYRNVINQGETAQAQQLARTPDADDILATGTPESRVRPVAPGTPPLLIPKPYTQQAPVHPSVALDAHVNNILADPTNIQHHLALANHLEQQGSPLHRVIRDRLRTMSNFEKPLDFPGTHPKYYPQMYEPPVQVKSSNGSTVTFQNKAKGVMSFIGPSTHVTYTPRGMHHSQGYATNIPRHEAEHLHKQLTAPPQAAEQPVQMAGYGKPFRGGLYAKSFMPTPSSNMGWMFLNPQNVPKPPTHYEALNNWFEKNKKIHQYTVQHQDGRLEPRTTEYAKIGHNRDMTRDPLDGSIHIRLHNTNVVTAHPDNTYTLRTTNIGHFGGWRTPLTHGTQSYFAPKGFSWRSPGFFNGIRINSQGVPVHQVFGNNPAFAEHAKGLLNMIKQVQANPGDEAARTALNVAMRFLGPSINPPKTRPNMHRPPLAKPNAQAIGHLRETLRTNGLDPYGGTVARLTHELESGGKPYTAHAIAQLHGRSESERPPMGGWYQTITSGRVGSELPVHIATPQPNPGNFVDPRWRIFFGHAMHPTTGVYMPLETYVPQHIGKGILHEVDPESVMATGGSAFGRVMYKRALKTYPHPGAYPHASPTDTLHTLEPPAHTGPAPLSSL